MGIDIYAKWRGQTSKEEDAQLTGFSIQSGHVGYLREAYHGGPYVTRFLLSESFAAEECEAKIPAATLRNRLPAAVLLALFRDHIVYGEAESPPGVVVEGSLDDALAQMPRIFADIKAMKGGKQESALVEKMTAEHLRMASEMIASRKLPPVALAFVDFVSLCEAKEAATGEPVTILASY